MVIRIIRVITHQITWIEVSTRPDSTAAYGFIRVIRVTRVGYWGY
jgi:hypothetical protein